MSFCHSYVFMSFVLNLEMATQQRFDNFIDNNGTIIKDTELKLLRTHCI